MNLTIEKLTKKINEKLVRIKTLKKKNTELRAKLAMDNSNSSFLSSYDRFIKKR